MFAESPWACWLCRAMVTPRANDTGDNEALLNSAMLRSAKRKYRPPLSKRQLKPGSWCSGKFRPGVRCTHVDNPDSFHARLRRFTPEQARELAALDTARVHRQTRQLLPNDCSFPASVLRTLQRVAAIGLDLPIRGHWEATV
jgi:hypothetical protein